MMSCVFSYMQTQKREKREPLKKGYRNPTGFRRWVKVAKSSGLCYTYAMGTWKSKNRHKYLLQYHIIFVCKYRKKLLTSKQISDDIKQFSYEICQRYNVIIRHMETDKDHIHYMIETEPTMSVSKIVNLMKSYTTYHIWERYSTYLRKHFWKEHTFWTDGYFACSVGNVSEEMLKKYIENQGQKGRWQQMLKAYKYRVYPNNEQKMQIAKTFGCCRFVYNQTLAYKKDTYEQ